MTALLRVLILVFAVAHAGAQAQDARCQSNNQPLFNDIGLLDEAWTPLYRSMVANQPAIVRQITGHLEAIRQHEVALQALYQAELELFAATASHYNIPDDSYPKVVAALRQLDSGSRQPASNCLRQQHPQRSREATEAVNRFLREWQGRPDQFGAYRRGSSAAFTSSLLTRFLEADAQVEELVFRRTRAEQQLLRWLQQQQQMTRAVWTDMPVLSIADRAPGCFDKSRLPDSKTVSALQPGIDQYLQNLLRRPVPYEGYHSVAIGMCAAGLRNPESLQRLPAIKETLEQRTRAGVPPHPMVNEWLKKRDQLQAMETLVQGQEMAAQQLAELLDQPGVEAPVLRRGNERLRQLRQQIQQNRQRLQQERLTLERSVPAAIRQWEKTNDTRVSLTEVMKRYGLESVVDMPLSRDISQQLTSLQQAEKTMRQSFVTPPQEARLAIRSARYPTLLQAQLNFSIFHQQQIERFVQALRQNPMQMWSSGNRQLACGVRHVMAKALQQLDTSCLSTRQQQGLQTLLETLKNNVKF